MNPLVIATFSTSSEFDGDKRRQTINISKHLILLDKEETELSTLEKTMKFRLFAYLPAFHTQRSHGDHSGLTKRISL